MIQFLIAFVSTSLYGVLIIRRFLKLPDYGKETVKNNLLG